MSKKLKIALLCGGPSLERGISLNSARSVCDHLRSDVIEVLPIYFDHQKNAYEISRAQLYSNTPSDFDFKLKQTAKPLSSAAFSRFLRGVDLAFPVMHGPFGEDGEIQRFLEREGCPYIGSPVNACKKAFDKYVANEFISKNGFYTRPSVVLKSHLTDHKKVLDGFFQEHNIKRAIVKPATGGSSIGCYSVSTIDEALDRAHELFSKRVDTRVLVEPFCEGKEFTVIILQNRFGMPVAIMPTEMELSYKDHQIFDYRKKYLATRNVTYHCPPRFDNDVVERIQIQAQQLFTLFGMQDFARFDGWLMKDGNLWFSDFNPISGMEQNSFLFQQSSQIGMSHRDLIQFVVKNACRRHGIEFPDQKTKKSSKKKRINVLFGGKTAERQVSLMSGTNVWLKLRNSSEYDPHPYLLDTKHRVWRLPYSMTLNHTVEEIEAVCENAKKDEARLHELKLRVIDKLSALPGEITEELFLPEKMSLDEFINKSDRIFIGLHGGIGEDGTLQARLEKAKIPFNGSGSKASRICMDKYKTAEVLSGLEKKGILSANKKLVPVNEFRNFKDVDFRRYFKQLTIDLGSPTIIVKPHADGCSAGIARLYGPSDLQKYIIFVLKKAPIIPDKTLRNQHGIIEMPVCALTEVMFEQFITTDKVRVIGNKLKWQSKSNWIEITMGLLERNGKMKAMNPSLTVAIGNVLTLEEKFQGGTGVNITPPPRPYVRPSAVERAKKRMERVAGLLGLSGYGRIDAFMHVKTGELIIIEANTTPGLTPSTVIYQQALKESKSLYPMEFLEKIAKNAKI